MPSSEERKTQTLVQFPPAVQDVLYAHASLSQDEWIALFRLTLTNCGGALTPTKGESNARKTAKNRGLNGTNQEP